MMIYWHDCHCQNLPFYQRTASSLLLFVLHVLLSSLCLYVSALYHSYRELPVIASAS